CAREQSNYDYW
nr:immunoglobulin heavy chain junction region [Macaca mulatta]MOX00745.1 immunoglobulin heavy chain junction region [Macaca mulatta]MOX01514.1 immunoglobulin heavy chain junction region [Macaca mulatta]MOX02348.1 immunoglobulin heavy chain junction region [Macaca mulatta]MOX03849.1 immunoglobulin heavy chain junction region [Macaca mulatta]